MRPKWAFQLLPNTPDILGKGFRVDQVTQDIEDEVNRLLQRKFNFHGISKLVVSLGYKEGKQEYSEYFGVAEIYYPSFDVVEYAKLEHEQKRAEIDTVIANVFNWLSSNFDDAQIFEDTLKNWQGNR